MKSYKISPNGKSITCFHCGRTSHNKGDVKHLYCGNCGIYHTDANEYDCTECGRHIIVLNNPVLQAKHPNICAACWSIPGWFNDPHLARDIDPDHTRNPPKA